MDFSERMHGLRIRSECKADEHRITARQRLDEIEQLEGLHPGDIAQQFRADETRRLTEEARRLEIEAKICDRRVAFLNAGTLPNGPDEINDHQWMKDVEPVFLEANSAGITKSTRDSLRDWM